MEIYFNSIRNHVFIIFLLINDMNDYISDRKSWFRLKLGIWVDDIWNVERMYMYKYTFT